MTYPKLIFIHIHKTGGKSLLKVFDSVYGSENVMRFNRNRLRKSQLDVIPHTVIEEDQPTVLGGHFTFREVHNIYTASEAKIITWLRHPVERVISNYKWRTHLNILQKMDKPLPDFESFIQKKKNINRIQRFLEGKNISEFDFIGFQHRMKEDIQLLAKTLKWTDYNYFHVNAISNIKLPKIEIHSDMIDAISALNQADIELYQEALSLRKIKAPHREY